jgi:hypothetical protein
MDSYGTLAFLNQLAPQIVAEIQTAAEIKKFTSNTAIIGQYVEASVRQFIRKYLSPIRVSTGGVIDQDQTPGGYISQLDTIAWIPGPVAAIFEIGDFGLVPRSSCLGVLEIKSSAYGDGVDNLDERTSPAFVTPVTAPIAEAEIQAAPILRDRTFGLGVVSLLEEDQKGSSKLNELRTQERVSVIYEQAGDKLVPQEVDIYRLVNFLTILRFRASKRDGQFSVTFPR